MVWNRESKLEAAALGQHRLTTLAPAAAEQLVIDTVAELTRYPREILLPSAQLEDDLGIDSVKRLEILKVLGTRLGIEPPAEASADAMPVVKTIEDIVGLLLRFAASGAYDTAHDRPNASAQRERFPTKQGALERARRTPYMGVLNGTAHPPSGARWQPAMPSLLVPDRDSEPARSTAGEVRAIVLQTVATLTRYPAEILLEEANFEDDLGIDSVKRAEIIGALGKRFGLSAPPENQEPPRTIGELIKLTERVVLAAGGAASAAVRSKHPVAPPPAAAATAVGASRATAPALRALHAPRLEAPPETRERPTAGIAASYPQHDPLGGLLGARRVGDRPFEGRIALVTGSGHGLGKVIASQLAALGATVVINSFYSRERGEQTAAEINARGDEAVHVWGSVANPKQLRAIFEEIDRRYGALDFFVQNAANGMLGPIDKIQDEHWDRAFRTSVVGFHQGALLAAELMKRRGGGAMVALSAPSAHRYVAHYGCLGPVKAAAESLALYLAVELAKYDIRVNVVSAGPVYGERLDSYPESDRLVRFWQSVSPDKRLADPLEVSNTVAFLLSPSASKVNGTVLLVDGALTLVDGAVSQQT